MVDHQTIQQVTAAATNGSPFVLHAAGRFLGLGVEEQHALANGKLPFWLWIALGVGAGWAIGVQAQKRRWAPGWLSGR